MKAFLAKIFAKRIVKKEQKWIDDPIQTQDRILKELIAFAKNTTLAKSFG